MNILKKPLFISAFIVLNSFSQLQAKESYFIDTHSTLEPSLVSFDTYFRNLDLTDGMTCGAILTHPDLEKLQVDNIKTGCEDLLLVEHFDKPLVEITNSVGTFVNRFFTSVLRDAKYKHLSAFYPKWNLYRGLSESDGYRSHWVNGQGTGIGVRLGSGAAGNAPSLMQTLQSIPLVQGTYRVSVKFKPTVAYHNTHLQGFDLRIIDNFGLNSAVYSTYTPYYSDNRWLVAEFLYTTNFSNRITLELEQLITGNTDGSIVIGNVILYKVDPSSLPIVPDISY